MKVKLVHGGGGGGGGGGGMRKLAWHFWGGTLCYGGGGNPVTLILKMQPVMPTGSPMPLQVFSCPLTLQGRVLHVVSPASLQEPLAA